MRFIFKKEKDERGYGKDKEWKEFILGLGDGARVGFEEGYQRWSAPPAIRSAARRGVMPLATIVSTSLYKDSPDYTNLTVGVRSDLFLRNWGNNCGGKTEFGFGRLISTNYLTVVLECSGSAKELTKADKALAREKKKKETYCKKYHLRPDGSWDPSY